VMRIENAYHPMLDTSRNKETVIMNNVVSWLIFIINSKCNTIFFS
jgi:hypothetical protein